jgi:methylated-DNA-[protein]-cysteine S-methyltransferase
MTVVVTRTPSPLGEIVIATRELSICVLEFTDVWPRAALRLGRALPGTELTPGDDPAGVVPRLDAYFRGDLESLTDLRIEPRGTAFQQRVWSALRTIRPGCPITYRDLARRVGCPSGFRAVGAANGLNSLAIVVPCHRVVGADGRLCGYAGGLERKQWLLDHEARHAPRTAGRTDLPATPVTVDSWYERHKGVGAP